MKTMTSNSVFDQPSRRNRIDIRLHGQPGIDAVDKLYGLVEQARKADGKRGYGKQAQFIKLHIEIIAADLYSSWISDPALYVGYSRSEDSFDPGGPYSALSYSAFTDIITVFETNQLLENHIQSAGYGGKASSRMRATGKLADLIEGHGINWASLDHDQTAEVLVLKTEKDKSGDTEDLPIDDQADERIPKMRENLRAINEALGATLINLNVPDAVLVDINERLRDDPEAGAIDFANRHLRRIFNNASWDDGGRFYGGWWQSVPSEYRQFIEIEGKMTEEWDYSSMAPSILYAMEGHPVPGDAYDIPGWIKAYPQISAKGMRGLIKKTFNQVLNSSKSTASEKQWFKLAPDLKPASPPANWHNLKDHQKCPFQREEFKRLTGREYNELIKDVISHHQPIEHYFFSKAWSWLQRIDSDIAEKVMLRMLEEEIVVLPIHDSFICRKGFRRKLRQVMNVAFQEEVNAMPSMKSDIQELTEHQFLSQVEHEEVVNLSELMNGLGEYLSDTSSYIKRKGQWIEVWGLSGWD